MFLQIYKEKFFKKNTKINMVASTQVAIAIADRN